MVQSDSYHKSLAVGVTSEVGLTTDRRPSELSLCFCFCLLCLRNTASFIHTGSHLVRATIQHIVSLLCLDGFSDMCIPFFPNHLASSRHTCLSWRKVSLPLPVSWTGLSLSIGFTPEAWNMISCLFASFYMPSPNSHICLICFSWHLALSNTLISVNLRGSKTFRNIIKENTYGDP